MKLLKNTYPTAHTANDFKAFGPAATHDGRFDGVMIADLGFFDQSEQDSNKFYHGAVVQSKIDNQWYAYFEWGRTGASNNSFQFETASSQNEAHEIFAKQMHSKNDKRGQWSEIAGIKTLTCKEGKDCYLVRSLATRVTGLPDAKTIVSNDGAKLTTPTRKISKTKKIDALTIKLLRDLSHGTIEFTRGSMADASIPTQNSIDEARQILDAASVRVGLIGGKIEQQVADNELMSFTSLLYKRIPKKKERNAVSSSWILSDDNISNWRNDLDAFEGALYAKINDEISDVDPYDGMNIHMEHIGPRSLIGGFLREWWPQATRNRHPNMGEMIIVNAWSVTQHDGAEPFANALKTIEADHVLHHPLHQPPERFDLDESERALCEKSHVGLLQHASRSCNVIGILRKRLLLPKKLQGVSINGALLGPGLYHADDIKKSAQYASVPKAAWSKGAGAIDGRHGFMFINDVILGNPYLAPDTFGFTEPPDGRWVESRQLKERYPWLRYSDEKNLREIVGRQYHSVFGKGGHTARLENNEWVVYNEAQHRIRYLIEFREKEKPGDRRFA